MEIIELSLVRDRIGVAMAQELMEAQAKIAKFRQIRFYWKDNDMEIHFAVESFPELAERVRLNPAWGLRLFSAVTSLELGDIHPRISFVHGFQFAGQVMIVHYGTINYKKRQILVGRDRLAKTPFRISF
jgi:hypothetical protein